MAADDSGGELPDIPGLIVAPNASGVAGSREQRVRHQQRQGEQSARDRLNDNPSLHQEEFERLETERLAQLRASLPHEQAHHAALLPAQPLPGEGIEVRFNFRLPGGEAAHFDRRFPPESSAGLLRTAVLANPLAPNNNLVRVLQGFPPEDVDEQGTLQQAFGGQRRVAVIIRPLGNNELVSRLV